MFIFVGEEGGGGGGKEGKFFILVFLLVGEIRFLLVRPNNLGSGHGAEALFPGTLTYAVFIPFKQISDHITKDGERFLGCFCQIYDFLHFLVKLTIHLIT